MFNPSEHFISLKGKDYLQVMWRLVWFREDHPDYGIDTLMLEHDDDHAVFVCKITDDTGRQLSSGHGSESKRDFGDFTEKAETKAVGRALAMLGYGTQFAADELDEGERIVDSPVPVKNTASNGVYCDDCGKVIMGNESLTPQNWAKKSKEVYGRILCDRCGKRARELREMRTTV